MARELEEGPEEAAADVERFVAELASRGAITAARGALTLRRM